MECQSSQKCQSFGVKYTQDCDVMRLLRGRFSAAGSALPEAYEQTLPLSMTKAIFGSGNMWPPVWSKSGAHL